MKKLSSALKNHISTTKILEKSALNYGRSSEKLAFAIRTFPSGNNLLDAKTSAKLAFAARTFPATTEALGRSLLSQAKTSPKLTFAARTFRQNYSLDKLLKMKEVDLVKVANSLGLKVSKKDLKNETIEKIIRKQIL